MVGLRLREQHFSQNVAFADAHTDEGYPLSSFLATSVDAPFSTVAATQDSHPGWGSLPLSEQTHAHGAEMFGEEKQ
jgi:hypothetical protein